MLTYFLPSICTNAHWHGRKHIRHCICNLNHISTCAVSSNECLGWPCSLVQHSNITAIQACYQHKQGYKSLRARSISIQKSSRLEDQHVWTIQTSSHTRQAF